MFKHFLLALILTVQATLFAEVSQGEEMEKKMWENIKDHQWDDLINKISPSFQLAIFDGVRNKDQYLNHAKGSKISSYELSNFKVTDSPDLLVVTYDVSVSETIAGKPLSSKSVRLSVWQKNQNGWQWVAHAVLIPIPAP